MSDLAERFSGVTSLDPAMTRRLSSFQDSRGRPRYRWYRYKEAFSPRLVRHLMSEHKPPSGPVLDPFAGSGTTLFACSSMGRQACGIELLPVAHEIIEAGMLAMSRYRDQAIMALRSWADAMPWRTSGESDAVPETRLSVGAYPDETSQGIGRFLRRLREEEQVDRKILLFALLCVLEDVSYASKDGQFLRWDSRAERPGHRRRGRFRKRIRPLDEALVAKMTQVADDMAAYISPSKVDLKLLRGSCLDIMPGLTDETYAAVLTSPPYCNRYDYTRTYALEHVLLGLGEERVLALRQAMLSCTIESRGKDLVAMRPRWAVALAASGGQPVLHAILDELECMAKDGKLNDKRIPRMIRGYFDEMACVIQEWHRLLRPGGLAMVVNDNVRYAGLSIPVDHILCAIAEDIGLRTRHLVVLPGSKGNSSQQMGRHGRESLRKCIYVWEKTKT